MNLFVNMKGLIPGKIKVKDIEEAEMMFSVLVEVQNIPGVGPFDIAVLKDSMGRIVESWEFDNYL